MFTELRAWEISREGFHDVDGMGLRHMGLMLNFREESAEVGSMHDSIGRVPLKDSVDLTKGDIRVWTHGRCGMKAAMEGNPGHGVEIQNAAQTLKCPLACTRQHDWRRGWCWYLGFKSAAPLLISPPVPLEGA